MKFFRLLKYGFLGLLSIALLYNLWVAAHIFWWRTHNPTSTAFMRTQLSTLQETQANAQILHRWVTYDRISPAFKKAVIRQEDQKFFTHNGFDWDGIHFAFQRNLKAGKVVAGGSTITQQLAKNLFLSKSRNPLRKIEEAVITLMLETMLPKKRIFEIYLNIIQLGDNVFGIETAAYHYYKIPAAQLSPQQATRLVAVIPNPSKRRVLKRPKK